ncbi:MAG: Gfo/Idh/MocA family oxidoreductase [Eubacteriales bacterium]|nr:Gfo/Idh/MocA family oxidoreductase [Eubacteriales bacterium]
MKNFAMLGKWHVHAPQYAEVLRKLPGCRVAKVWDPNETVAQEWAKELGCESASLENILADESIEGVVIGTATNEHTQVILRAVEAGKALFTEKVLALTNEDAELLRDAVLKHHTRFAISFPHINEAGVRFALQTALSGKLGSVNYARVRKAHDGATAGWLPAHFFDAQACGGGAMIDLGAHPMYLLCALLGEPERVQSEFTQVTGKGVEDNAVSLIRFANGAIGVSETGFVSRSYPFTVEIGGTEGGLLLRDNDVTYCCPETDNKWRTPEALPESLPLPLAQWALADKPEDIPAEIGIDVAVRLTRVMVAAYAAK